MSECSQIYSVVDDNKAKHSSTVITNYIHKIQIKLKDQSTLNQNDFSEQSSVCIQPLFSLTQHPYYEPQKVKIWSQKCFMSYVPNKKGVSFCH